METATKTGINAAKTASKRVVQKTEEATGDLIGYKIADKLLHLVNQKKNKKQWHSSKFTFQPKKDNELLTTLNCFEHEMWFLLYKNGISKNCNFTRYDI